ncbi:MAG TPA: glucokinase [Geminicoccaceae bacterium]|nr:glucokinase [Geminicoccus sp.]HMU49174.1 glucokinase [Geminicoccaceae bacterium]
MTRLVGDIGGTNARFALAEPGGEPGDEQILPVAGFPGLAEAARAFLGARAVDEAVLAVATPVETDEVRFTNSPWSFSISRLGPALGVKRLAVINDFVAQALAIPHLTPRDLEVLHHGEPLADRPVGVIGPGTGLGVAGLVPVRGRWHAVSTEGGHTSLAPGNARELALLGRISGHFPHVSKERLISGPGLLTIVRGLAELDGVASPAARPEDVADLARAGASALCEEAIGIFSAQLGAAAGDLALTWGARGGVYVCGGLCLSLGPLFDRALFVERFLAKGRMRPYLAPIPVWLVHRTGTGLLGAARHVLDDPGA